MVLTDTPDCWEELYSENEECHWASISITTTSQDQPNSRSPAPSSNGEPSPARDLTSENVIFYDNRNRHSSTSSVTSTVSDRTLNETTVNHFASENVLYYDNRNRQSSNLTSTGLDRNNNPQASVNHQQPSPVRGDQPPRLNRPIDIDIADLEVLDYIMPFDDAPEVPTEYTPMDAPAVDDVICSPQSSNFWTEPSVSPVKAPNRNNSPKVNPGSQPIRNISPTPNRSWSDVLQDRRTQHSPATTPMTPPSNPPVGECDLHNGSNVPTQNNVTPDLPPSHSSSTQNSNAWLIPRAWYYHHVIDGPTERAPSTASAPRPQVLSPNQSVATTPFVSLNNYPIEADSTIDFPPLVSNPPNVNRSLASNFYSDMVQRGSTERTPPTVSDPRPQVTPPNRFAPTAPTAPSRALNNGPIQADSTLDFPPLVSNPATVNHSIASAFRPAPSDQLTPPRQRRQQSWTQHSPTAVRMLREEWMVRTAMGL